MHSAAQPPTQWVGVSSRGRVYEVVSCTFFCIAFVTVVLRVIARMKQFGRLFADDYLAIVSQILGFCLMAQAIIFTEAYAMGWHVVDVPPAQIEKFYMLFYTAEITYSLVSPFYKLAVIFLYRRIFGDVKTFNFASWIVAGLSIGWGVASLFATAFQCTPVSKAWNALLPGHCINISGYILGLGIGNMLIDAIILVLPLPLIWKLQMGVKKKLVLSSMFLLGSVVVLASVLRVTNLIPIDLSDGTYTLVDVAIWSEIEPAVGIIGACLPTLRQFFFGKSSGIAKSTTWSFASNRKTPLDQSVNSHTAVALTGWHANGAYKEVKSNASGYQTPAKNDLESNSTYAVYEPPDRETHRLDFGNADLNRSILVNHEISVRYDGE